MKYGGVLICAIAQDYNNHIYPISFTVVDVKKDNSWIWFMEKLKDCILDNDQLYFISDCHRSIGKVIAQEYPLTHHKCCLVHRQT